MHCVQQMLAWRFLCLIPLWPASNSLLHRGFWQSSLLCGVLFPGQLLRFHQSLLFFLDVFLFLRNFLYFLIVFTIAGTRLLPGSRLILLVHRPWVDMQCWRHKACCHVLQYWCLHSWRKVIKGNENPQLDLCSLWSSCLPAFKSFILQVLNKLPGLGVKCKFCIALALVEAKDSPHISLSRVLAKATPRALLTCSCISSDTFHVSALYLRAFAALVILFYLQYYLLLYFSVRWHS